LNAAKIANLCNWRGPSFAKNCPSENASGQAREGVLAKSDLSEFLSAFNLMNWAPRSLDQPILPGWQFGNVVINYDNSSSPETERQIVSAQSYGRQIGRLMDAVCVLINKQEESREGLKALEDLVKLHKEIENIKVRVAERKIELLRKDLELIKRNRPAEYRAMIAELKGLLAENS
jgi:hypothetical protein